MGRVGSGRTGGMVLGFEPGREERIKMEREREREFHKERYGRERERERFTRRN